MLFNLELNAVNPTKVGNVPKPKQNMTKAPCNGLEAVIANDSAVYTKPQGRNPQNTPYNKHLGRLSIGMMRFLIDSINGEMYFPKISVF